MKLWTIAGLLLAVGAGACTSVGSLLDEMEPVAVAAHPQDRLVWEIENRNRLFKGQGEQDRFERDLASYIEEYRHWHVLEERSNVLANFRDTDLIHAREDDPIPVNYRVNYDPGANSYRCNGDAGSPVCRPGQRSDWIADQRRTVKLSFGTGTCRWAFDGVERTAPCGEVRQTVVIDLPMRVRVERFGDAAVAEETIEARDIVILALGDSFSAGEGNPHRQWRLGEGPADWLDARCHRSLMSGPALTAAMLARTNPHASVTLLHYGCSGASVADGLVTPWAQLETAADIRRQYEAFGIRGEEFDALRVATARPQLHDVPLSQIAQARRDLSVRDRMIVPDYIVISIGGNDVGFGSIVAGLAVERGTVVDLRTDPGSGGLEQVDDWRPYASFDQASWVQSSRNVPCFGLDRVECMARRVQDRISGASSEHGRMTLTKQYEELATALRPLASAAPRQVFMTQYPNFVMRERDGVPAGLATSADAVGCNDAVGDGRPGFIPGVFAVLPGVGMDATTSAEAESRFLTPINSAISDAAKEFQWAVVSSHVENAKTHGYCSHHRYYNTLLDSYWDQGRRYETGRPLGNLVILRPDNLFNLPVGTRLIWDAQRGCFVSYPVGSGCHPAPHRLPVLELRREIADGASLEDMVAKPSTLGTSGPVHPNLFGHCNYASAILTSFVRQRPDMPYGRILAEAVSATGAEGLKADFVCDPAQWGFRHAVDHSDASLNGRDAGPRVEVAGAEGL